MDIEQLLSQILVELQKTPNISVVNTVLNGQDAVITLFQQMPCSPDIYVVFVDRTDGSLYALQNIGSVFWGHIKYEIDKEEYILLPVTNYLIKNREKCIGDMVKWCRQSALGNIPIRAEEFYNPLI